MGRPGRSAGTGSDGPGAAPSPPDAELLAWSWPGVKLVTGLCPGAGNGVPAFSPSVMGLLRPPRLPASHLRGHCSAFSGRRSTHAGAGAQGESPRLAVFPSPDALPCRPSAEWPDFIHSGVPAPVTKRHVPCPFVGIWLDQLGPGNSAPWGADSNAVAASSQWAAGRSGSSS